MATKQIAVQRFSVTSSKSFGDVVKADEEYDRRNYVKDACRASYSSEWPPETR
jgi:hypothetical protein